MNYFKIGRLIYTVGNYVVQMCICGNIQYTVVSFALAPLKVVLWHVYLSNVCFITRV